jgi:hypothetical protein
MDARAPTARGGLRAAPLYAAAAMVACRSVVACATATVAIAERSVHGLPGAACLEAIL